MSSSNFTCGSTSGSTRHAVREEQIEDIGTPDVFTAARTLRQRNAFVGVTP